MKKSLPAALLAAAVLPGCVLFGIYSYTTTVRFSEIVQLPDGEEVTVKRKQWIKKEGYYVGKSSRTMRERLTIIDPETREKLPTWENEKGGYPYFLYRGAGDCLWILIANPFKRNNDYFINRGDFKIIDINGEKYYTPTVLAYCLSEASNQWKKISVPDYVVEKKPNIWLNDSSKIPSTVIREKNGKPKNKPTSYLRDQINEKLPFIYTTGD